MAYKLILSRNKNIKMKTLANTTVNNKSVLVRVDLNVPLDDSFNVTDDTRIQAIVPTIHHLKSQHAKITLISHLGRPKGQVNPDFSLKHIVDKLSEALGSHIVFVEDCIGDTVAQSVQQQKDDEIILLENVRFYPEEELGDAGFAQALARPFDAFVNDAFGTAHRAHASTTRIAEYIDTVCFGLLMEKELAAIEQVLSSPKEPVLAIVGGAKVSSKVPIIKHLLAQMDTIIIGGGMSYTFSKALGGKIGHSLCEDDQLQLAIDILKEAEVNNTTILLPTDSTVADAFSEEANQKVVKSGEIEDGWMGLDLGPESIELFSRHILKAKTILWNGPLGVFEMPPFAKGTCAIGDAIYEATENGAFSLVGGGDSVAAVKQYGYAKKVSYVSTGGGAMLESLEGKTLPGIAAIESHKSLV